MKDDFDYRLVPFNYIHCLNQDCPRGGDCLRRLAAQHAPETTPYVTTVNPAAYPKDPEHCPHFRSTEKVRFAWGMDTIYDNIPYKTALLLKRNVRALYSKTTYYRILNKERSLSPAEQEAVACIFARNGIAAAPAYDSYTEEYDFRDREES